MPDNVTNRDLASLRSASSDGVITITEKRRRPGGHPSKSVTSTPRAFASWWSIVRDGFVRSPRSSPAR